MSVIKGVFKCTVHSGAKCKLLNIEDKGHENERTTSLTDRTLYLARKIAYLTG
jgi:hypothetical protein